MLIFEIFIKTKNENMTPLEKISIQDDGDKTLVFRPIFHFLVKIITQNIVI